jgi:hypothetical protein
VTPESLAISFVLFCVFAVRAIHLIGDRVYPRSSFTVEKHNSSALRDDRSENACSLDWPEAIAPSSTYRREPKYA